MPAKFTNHIREFIASSLISNISSGRLVEWAANTSYNVGQRVSANGNIYVCYQSGTSGTVLPSHISDKAVDGSTGWVYVETQRIDKLFEGNMYLAIGKTSEWADPLVPDGILAIDSEETSVINNMITLKKINPNDAKACVTKNLWTTGAVYSQYDDEKEVDAYVQPFYVITDDLRVYKCLDNNGGVQSTSKPAAVQTNPFRMSSDGYIWKFIGTINASNANLFMTDEFAPVNVVKSAIEDPEQWAVQNDAADHTNSISAWVVRNKIGAFDQTPNVVVIGAGTNSTAAANVTANDLTQVYVNNPGKDYVKASTHAIVKNGSPAGSGAVATAAVNGTTGAINSISVTGGGSGYTTGAVAVLVGVPKAGQVITPAVLEVNVSSGTVSSINVTTAGLNYASATVYVIPGTAGAVATPVMAPVNGHGSNIIKELGASTVMIGMKMTNVSTDAGYALTGVGSDFHQVSIITDVVDKITGKFATSGMIMGPLHPDYALTTNENPANGGTYKSKVKAGSGTILYINNNKKVVRSEDQEEDIKVAITL